MNDETTEEEIRQLMQVADDKITKIRQSRVFVAMLEKTGIDPILAMQVGVAILLDKPLVFMATSDCYVSPRLRQIGAAVIHVGDLTDPAERERVRALMEAAFEKAKAERPM